MDLETINDQFSGQFTQARGNLKATKHVIRLFLLVCYQDGIPADAALKFLASCPTPLSSRIAEAQLSGVALSNLLDWIGKLRDGDLSVLCDDGSVTALAVPLASNCLTQGMVKTNATTTECKFKDNGRHWAVDLGKICFVVVLTVILWTFDFFALPQPEANEFPAEYARRASPWLFGVVFYFVGLYCLCWGNRTSGNIHPISLRGWYVLMGCVSIIVGIFLMDVTKTITSW